MGPVPCPWARLGPLGHCQMTAGDMTKVWGADAHITARQRNARSQFTPVDSPRHIIALTRAGPFLTDSPRHNGQRRSIGVASEDEGFAVDRPAPLHEPGVSDRSWKMGLRSACGTAGPQPPMDCPIADHRLVPLHCATSRGMLGGGGGGAGELLQRRVLGRRVLQQF